MCGLSGCLEVGSHPDRLEETVLKMSRTLRHRGPDDEGSWIDAQAGVGLGHRRLSIIDTSAQGHQPMVAASGRYVIVLNGEIYNHHVIRLELERSGKAPKWRGHSDTEVLLAAIDHWGFTGTLERSVGMFAIALWDREERALHLARDRLGEKPLYYGWQGESFVFGSELKALRAHPDFSAPVDKGALSLFLRLGYVPAPYSIYTGIFKLAPGSTLAVRPGERDARHRTYWAALEQVQTSQRTPYEGTPEEAVTELERLLTQSLTGQMVADVPLGAFLSGGIDSSTVVSLMQRLSPRPIKTFSIGFTEQAFDEAAHARAVAEYLGTDHSELYVEPDLARSVIPRLPTLYDEPFADSSQIPTYLLSELAKTQVTVSLSGDGADELLGGYNRYSWAARIWRTARWIPHSVRTMAGRLSTQYSHSDWDRILGALRPFVPNRHRYPHPGYKLQRLANAIAARTPDDFYLELVSQWTQPGEVVLNAQEPQVLPHALPDQQRLPALAHRMMYADLVSYLPDDILVKVDRAAMAVSLETRVPYLDHRIVEFAWRLPLSMKIRHGQGKWILRQILGKHVPQSLTNRAKTGFAVPIGQWLRGPLRDWAENLLDERSIRSAGLLNPSPIRRKWTQHVSGAGDWQYHLWHILMFQAWHEHKPPL